MPLAIDLDDVHAARDRIRGHVHTTPVLTSSTLNEHSGCELFFKCENLQRIGAFKIRGAMNAVLALDTATASRGVVTHSSGNHAQALAVAAAERSIPCHVVMPTSAPAAKRAAVLGYGAQVYDCEPTLESRLRGAARVQSETGATLIPPFDHPDVIAGQGTCALELLDQAPALDTLVAPVGGGGLLSGTAIVARGRGVRVVGAEPLGADDTARSKAAGTRQENRQVDTIADGLMTNVGELTWPIIDAHVSAIITRSDAQIIEAMRLVFERMKLVIEPSSAVAVAALLGPQLRALGARRVGVILSGGNVDLSRLPF